ncbi:hypothetical protein [Lonepinella koalarum]|uniref:DNA-damage-inducible protein D n=1 Tax=Lonepinella koalarum TaxID=53417 RepID=A0A4R1KZN2_9PAST|nr:hypothetical protein [Lonepinella koalarum]TCK70147.1 hypothetical protein EV692_1374 [Lonepinella koalarum]
MAEQFDLELFENDAHQNGIRYWIAHDFMQHLGYESWNTFKSVIIDILPALKDGDSY